MESDILQKIDAWLEEANWADAFDERLNKAFDTSLSEVKKLVQT